MSVTLGNMKDWAQTAIGVSDSSYVTNDYHRAIRAAGEQYHAEVQPSTQSTSITIANGATSVDVTATITDFVQGDLVGQEAYISNFPVKLVAYQKIARRLQGTPASGRPGKMAFLSDDALYFDKAADQEYTLILPHADRLTTFADGADASTELNLPRVDAARLANTLVVWYLLKGAYDETNEIAQAWQGWQQLLADAKQRFPSTASAIRDRQAKK